MTVLVPFYRGAVVFRIKKEINHGNLTVLVPFYRGAVVFTTSQFNHQMSTCVLVPFYRGAVVFTKKEGTIMTNEKSSRPLLSRSGCI